VKIILCTKQVPNVESVGFNEETRTIVREGVMNEINPYDRRALGMAAELKKKFGGEIVAVTMGPPQAIDVLHECMAVGADRGVHLCHPAFAGSDTLATARALAAFIKKEEPDLVFCGKYSVDAETGQVGPELAELLGIPQVTGATSLEFDEAGKRATVGRETDEGIETVEVNLPVLLTAAERLIRPPRVTPDDIDRVKDLPVERLTPADLGLSPDEVGFKGSPTWVAEIYSVKPNRQGKKIDGEDAESASKEIVDLMLARGLFGTWVGESAPQPVPANSASADPSKSVWVAADIVNDTVSPVTLELLGGAVEVAGKIGGQVAALLIGNDVAKYVDTLAAFGASTVYLAESSRLESYDTEAHTEIVSRAIETHKPWALLISAHSNGRDYAPRVAARLGLGLTGDAVGLDLDAEGRLLQLKPAFGGTIVAPIISNTFPQMATVRGGMLDPRIPDENRVAVIVNLPVDNLPDARTRLVDRDVEAGAAGLALDTADVVVCAGNGLGDPSNLHYVDELALVLDGAVGATRRVVDAGWLPRQQQVGLTGKVLAPKLYVGVGVRGVFNHTIGIQRAGLVVSINTDPEAPIVEHSDYTIIGDYQKVVPALVSALKEARLARKG
jgi:electron transfer flavoprotein alpha subunit